MITDTELNSIVIISGITMMTLIVIYHAISSTFEQKQWNCNLRWNKCYCYEMICDIFFCLLFSYLDGIIKFMVFNVIFYVKFGD